MAHCIECEDPMIFFGRSGKNAWCKCNNRQCSEYGIKVIFRKDKDDNYVRQHKPLKPTEKSAIEYGRYDRNFKRRK